MESNVTLDIYVIAYFEDNSDQALRALTSALKVITDNQTYSNQEKIHAKNTKKLTLSQSEPSYETRRKKTYGTQNILR